MAAKKKKTSKAKKKSTTRSRTAKKPREVLLVASKVRQTIKDANCNTAGDAVDGLNEWVHFLIAQACQRASLNGRKTVRSHDFIVT